MSSSPRLKDLVLIEPGVYVRVLDLDYQAEQFAVFHTRGSTRWAHYLGTQVIVGCLLLLAGSAHTAALVAVGLFLGAWYFGMHRLVGLVATTQVVLLGLSAWWLVHAFGPLWREALATLALMALFQNLSHAVEPVPPTLTCRGFEPFALFWASAGGFERSRLLALNLLYIPLELVSAPRLFAVHVLRAMHRLGWQRAWADAVSGRAARILGGPG